MEKTDEHGDNSSDPMKEIYNEEYNTYVEKNEDYGDSWRKVAYLKMIMQTEDPEIIELEDGSRAIKINPRPNKNNSPKSQVVEGMMTRMLDKINRIYEITFYTDRNIQESLEDSVGDLGNYSFMLKGFLRDD